MEPARAPDLLEFLADFRNPLADDPAVGFDLGFAGPAQKAEATALPLKMGPAADKPALLIIEMGEFDLQASFPRVRPLAENFENERRAIEDFGVPGFFE